VSVEIAKATGQIFVPDTIEGDTARHVCELMMIARDHAPDRAIKLYVNGYGGNTGQAFAIVDFIKSDGNVHGYLIGEAYSSHVAIWAACNKRFIGPYASVYLHQVQYQPDRHNPAFALRHHANHVEHSDLRIAQLLRCASCGCDTDYWLDIMKNAGPAVIMMTAQQLLERCMGELM